MHDAHTADHTNRSVAAPETDAAAVAPASWSWPGGLGEALWLFIILRLTLSLFALLASYLTRLPVPCAGGERAPVLQATGRAFRLLGVWERWDACWYEKIAAVGYQPNDPSVAFFPLYPLLMRAVSLPLVGNLTLAGLIVSGVAYIAAVTGLYQLVQYDFDEGVARRAVLYLSIFPSAFFLFAPFTEALFLALAVWTIYVARRGAWGWAALLALPVGLTRAQGALLALPLAWEVARQWRAGGRRLEWALVPLLPVCGVLAFVTYSKVFTGWTTFTAQRTFWGATPQLPWVVVARSWEHLRGRGDAIEALNLALLLAFGALFLLGLRRLPPAYTLYVAPQLLLISSRLLPSGQNVASPLMSTSRYVVVLFPLFILLALAGEHRRLHYSWLLCSTLLLALLLYAFLSGRFVA